MYLEPANILALILKTYIGMLILQIAYHWLVKMLMGPELQIFLQILVFKWLYRYARQLNSYIVIKHTWILGALIGHLL